PRPSGRGRPHSTRLRQEQQRRLVPTPRERQRAGADRQPARQRARARPDRLAPQRSPARAGPTPAPRAAGQRVGYRSRPPAVVAPRASRASGLAWSRDGVLARRAERPGRSTRTPMTRCSRAAPSGAADLNRAHYTRCAVFQGKWRAAEAPFRPRACSAARQRASSRRRGRRGTVSAPHGRRPQKEQAMAGMRLGTLVLALLVALAPQAGGAQIPRAAPAPLVDLFPADTIGYLEIQLRSGDGKGAPLDRLLADLLGQPELAAQAGPWAMLPQLARAAALGVAAEGENVHVMGVLAADNPATLRTLVLAAAPGARQVETYAGVPVYAIEGRHTTFLAATSAYLIAANDRDALAGVLDRARAGPSAPPGLAASPRYRTTIGRLPASRVVTGYVDSENLLTWLGERGAQREGAPFPRNVPAAPPGLDVPITPARHTGLQRALAAFESDGLGLAVQT